MTEPCGRDVWVCRPKSVMPSNAQYISIVLPHVTLTIGDDLRAHRGQHFLRTSALHNLEGWRVLAQARQRK